MADFQRTIFKIRKQLLMQTRFTIFKNTMIKHIPITIKRKQDFFCFFNNTTIIIYRFPFKIQFNR